MNFERTKCKNRQPRRWEHIPVITTSCANARHCAGFTAFFRIRMIISRFLSISSASIFLISVLALQLLAPPRFVDLHVSKLLFQPVDRHLGYIRLLADRRDGAFTWIHFPQYPDLVFRRISFAFPSSGPFNRLRLTLRMVHKIRVSSVAMKLNRDSTNPKYVPGQIFEVKKAPTKLSGL